jgi:hypothetical protein
VAKSRTQIAREHVARLRRKAQAYDRIVQELKGLQRAFHNADNYTAASSIRDLLEDEQLVTEKAVQE